MAAVSDSPRRCWLSLGGRISAYVWYMHGNTVFEARLVNRESGSYKGYPLDSDEWPKGIESLYAAA